MTPSGERRHNSLTREDVETAVQAAVKAAFNEHHSGADHVFLTGWMAREKRKQELWEKVKAHVAGWGAVAVLGYFFLILGDGFRDTIKNWVTR